MTSTKLRARPDLHFAPVPGGVYLSGTRGQVVLRGSDVLHAVAEGCVPLLENGATEDELVAELGTERSRPAVRHLVGKLRDAGLLLDPGAFTVPEPSPEERAPHAESVARLEARLDDPYAAFARLRAARVLVAGPSQATGPAARGLRRAGVGEVTVVEAPGSYDNGSYDNGYEGADAVLEMRTAADGTRLELPSAAHHLTVLLGDTVHVVGPVLAGGPEGAEAFHERALSWADESEGPVPRPVADAVAGALAGQLLIDTLTGTADAGEAHVVHGADLVSDRVTVGGARMAAATGRPGSLLTDVLSTPMPEPEDAREPAVALAGRFTGLFAYTADEGLPQMPLALRAVEQRGERAGTLVAWGPHQETATVAAALLALRDRAPGAAAGLTEEHWLLDGALRLLAPRAVELAGADASPDAEGERIRSALRQLVDGEPRLALRHVPGIDWPLAEVTTAAGELLGTGWGSTSEEALRAALCEAVAHAQTGRPPQLSTDALLFADRAVTGALRAQLTTHADTLGIAWCGHPVAADPVLGEIPFWYGPVEAAERTRETHDAQ
ncbi:hypothetical protein [Streptomyces sp. NPDC058297]|uniref:hypothetical protein n=1 Tax=Streptomyces sp. NPDC058297 TaxID=3346433 RepID=UPI0036F121A4